MVANTHQADDSFVGYVYQGYYALILLLDARDGESVSVETQDDVVLAGSNETLYQLKHSTKTPPALTVANVGFWKTIDIWASCDDISSKRFVFVTCASISESDELNSLRNSASSRTNLIAVLNEEAQRIIDEAKKATPANPKTSFKDRQSGCEAYLRLPLQERENLLNRIIVQPNSFNANQINEEVEKRLYLIPAVIRRQVAERLIEWWSRQVTLALLRRRDTSIDTVELHEQIHHLIKEFDEQSLPNDFSSLEPESTDEDFNSVMRKQIQIVNGGNSRIKRAIIVRWKARNQRQKWLEDDLIAASTLEDFDNRLIREWRDLHGPLCDDCSGKTEDVLCEKGCNILDWSHKNAPNEIQPPRPGWNDPFLIRGTYQQLADELRVGWHPQYKERLEALSEDKKQ